MKRKQTKWFDSAIIKEDELKTTVNSRHFILNNGTRRAVFSPNSTNYFDDMNKVWKPIDNSLKATEDGCLANLGKYTAKFSKKSDNETIEISNGTERISWEYIGINKNVFSSLGNATIKSNTKCKSKLSVTSEIADAMKLSSASRVVYTNAEGNIDIDYLIESNGVKENIKIKDKSDNYHYYFLLRVAGFEMKTAADGIGIEFYKVLSDTDDADGKTPQFIMPAPFMYDSNGAYSSNVKYAVEKIEDGAYIFSVEADPDWINAEERVFPVNIDPQLLTVSSSHITVTHDQYQWCDCSCSDCSCYDSYWTHTGNHYYPYINLYDNGSSKTTARLHIKKSDIDLSRNRLISAKLVFRSYSGQSYSSYAQIKIGNTICTHYSGSTMTANITGLYNSHSGDFDIDLSMYTSYSYRKFDIPTLQIEYQPLYDDPIRKTFAVESNASAELDVLSGNATIAFDDISDPVLGVSVSHVYKPNDDIVEYGQNFRLNLDEKLIKTSTSSTGAQYAYTDPHGDVHTFKEHFYKIGTNGEKVFITSGIGSITADTDGRLWLNGYEVFRELTTDRGLRASARLEGVVNNAEWVEQRLDEEKQLEEQVKSYKNTLCNFVSVNKETGAITSHMTESKLSSPDYVESFLSEIGCASHLMLSKEEALSYKSLLTQKESLNASNTALTLQKESLKNNANSMLLQYNSSNTFEYQKVSNTVQLASLKKERTNYSILVDEAFHNEDTDREDLYYDQLILIGGNDDNLSDETRIGLVNYHKNTIIPNQEREWNAQKNHILSQIRNFPNIGAPTGSNGTLTKQYNNTQEQIDILQKQLKDINAQISLYLEKSSKYVSQFNSYCKEYFNLKNQLDTLKTQVPVAYLISDSTVKGFNAKGELVIVQDKYGKYAVVEREKYNTSGKTRISAVYDQDGKTMSFSYNENNKLSEICNSLGERVAFSYDASGYLTVIERDDQPTLKIFYKEVLGVKRINKIESSNKTLASLAYNDLGMLTGVERTTTATHISHDEVSVGTSNNKLFTLGVEYTPTDTKLTYDKIKQEIYAIDPSTEQIRAHYELINDLVTSAERYTYSSYLLTKTERADKSCLGRYSYEEFADKMEIVTVEDVAYNSFKEPTSAVVSKYAVPRKDCDCPIEQSKVEYAYNDDRKLIEKKTTHWYSDNCEPFDITVGVERYYYNNAGELVRKESYIEGEELKTGINIEEHVFNDNGVEIRSFTYNSLDPSSKFYTENEVDEKGRAVAAFDESGEHKTTFDYERDGVTVKTERLPNGSKLSYGRDKDGTVSAITHSTEHGEENSTTQLSTLDVVTEVKSGNNTVRYEYDKKRRVDSVSLNGVDNYVTYAYSGENTNAEKVTATLAKNSDCEIIATTIKNAHGNVTKSTVGNRTVENKYNHSQQLEKTVDSVSGETLLTYDAKGNVETVTAPDHTETFAYDEQKTKLESKTITVNGVAQTYEYGYKPTADKALESISVDGKVVRPNTDALGRNTGKTIEVGDNKIAEEKISYVKFGDHATNMPSNVRFATNGVFNESIQYKYDSMGNIIEIFENGRTACRYEYDSLGRLTREDNVAFGKTTTWAYDNNGNIVARYEYAITAKPTNELHLLNGTCKLYTYDDNSDKLISYNGENFVYDTIGNPTTYRGKEAVWEYGRQLKSYNGTTFTYDARGRRISKQKTGETKITFTYDSNGNLIKQSNGLEFFYDHTGVFALKYNGSTYFYRKNAQNDIISLLDNTGETVVKYRYDAWGKCVVDTSTTNTELANINPFRYRSYYYDTETELYFLKTRYYDPEIGRFITIDDISYLDPESINGLNLYAYCFNNPVNCIDPTGNAPWWSWLISGLQLVGGIALCFVPGAQAIGVSMIVGGSLGLIANAVSPAIAQAIGGASSMANGWGAISTGISLLSFGTPGIIAGIGLMLVGGATMAFGANEIVTAASGTNYIQEWTGMSDTAYGWTYFGLNVASSVGTVAGRWGMRIAATTNLRSSPSTAKPYGKNVWKNNEYYYNGRGKPYWSRHNINMINDGTPNGFHLHVGFGRDGEHIYNYVDLIMKLILRGKFNI